MFKFIYCGQGDCHGHGQGQGPIYMLRISMEFLGYKGQYKY